MIISLKKFGTVLLSRPSGKEDFAACLPILREASDGETVLVDFDGVITFTPSWGDEFLRALHEMFPGRVKLKYTTNASVLAVLEILEQIYGESLPLEAQ